MPLDFRDGDFHFESEPMIFKGSIGKKKSHIITFKKLRRFPVRKASHQISYPLVFKPSHGSLRRFYASGNALHIKLYDFGHLSPLTAMEPLEYNNSPSWKLVPN